VHNVEASVVTLSVGNDTNTTHVTTTSNHGNDTSVELDEVGDLASCEVNLDCVVDLDGWIRVTDTRSKISSASLGIWHSNR
jgi:flagellar basal body rod protein FlgF